MTNHQSSSDRVLEGLPIVGSMFKAARLKSEAAQAQLTLNRGYANYFVHDFLEFLARSEDELYVLSPTDAQLDTIQVLLAGKKAGLIGLSESISKGNYMYSEYSFKFNPVDSKYGVNEIPLRTLEPEDDVEVRSILELEWMIKESYPNRVALHSEVDSNLEVAELVKQFGAKLDFIFPASKIETISALREQVHCLYDGEVKFWNDNNRICIYSEDGEDQENLFYLGRFMQGSNQIREFHVYGRNLKPKRSVKQAGFLPFDKKP